MISKQKIYKSLVNTFRKNVEITISYEYNTAIYNRWRMVDSEPSFNLDVNFCIDLIGLKILDETGGNEHYKEYHYILDIEQLVHVLKIYNDKTIQKVFRTENMFPIYAQVRKKSLDSLIIEK